jgi:hypothetical protein
VRPPLARPLFAEFLGSPFLAAGAVAIGVLRVLYPDITPEEAAEVMVPQQEPSPS